MFHGRGRGRRHVSTEPAPDIPINWRRLLGYLTPYKGRMAIAVVALAAANAINLAFPLVIVQLLDSVLREQDATMLTRLALGLLGLFFLGAIFNLIQSYSLNYIGERVVIDLR